MLAHNAHEAAPDLGDGWRTVDERIAMRKRLEAAQGQICALCGEGLAVMVWASPKWNKRSIDHVIPKALGGLDALGNMVAAHIGCNGYKGDRPPTGCELVWLMAVNARLGVGPVRW